MINPYAIGKRIYLRSPAEKDIEGKWYEWLSNPEITQFLGDRYWPNSVEAQRAFYDSVKFSRDRLVLAICNKETDEHIGVCNLSSISWVHRHADIAFLVGEKKYQNGSAGIEIMALLLDIAFRRLNLLNLRATHVSCNPDTPLLLRIFGFKEVGKFEKFSNFNGVYADTIYSQLSRENWEMRNLPKK